MEKFYIGLANGIHDPAMAVVDSDGEVIYAEGTERPLQNKRAMGLTADLRETVRRVIKEHCNPHAEFVVAKPLSQRAHRVLRVLNVLGATDHEQLPRRPGVMTKFLLEKNVLFAQTWLAYTSICALRRKHCRHFTN